MEDTNGPENGGLAKVAAAFEESLNRHGYSFQYALLKRRNELEVKNKTHWYFVGSEVPVECGGVITHIDFVCWSTPRNPQVSNRFFLIAECKRANPALAEWCFAKSPSRWQ